MSSLVVLVLYNVNRFEEVLAAWHDAGATAVTVLDAVGTRSAEELARRADLPILPRIRDLLQSDDAPRKIIFSVVRDEIVEPLAGATRDVMGELSEPQNGILFVLPVSQVMGLRGK